MILCDIEASKSKVNDYIKQAINYIQVWQYYKPFKY